MRDAWKWWRKNPVFCHKMPVYATHRDPTFGALACAKRFFPHRSRLMSRRHLSLVVVAIASLVISACNASPTGPQPTTPNHDTITNPPADTTGRIGYGGSNG
jgi:hypothetical protein